MVMLSLQTCVALKIGKIRQLSEDVPVCPVHGISKLRY